MTRKRGHGGHPAFGMTVSRLVNLAGVICLILAAALGQPWVGGEAAPVQTLTLAQATDVDTWDPFGDNTDTIINVKRNVYETLTTRDDQLRLVPLLAAGWQQTNPTTWRFTLRRNVTFHDGSPMTAQDVQYSIMHQLDPAHKLPCTSWIATISTVDVVNPFTVDIHTTAPDGILPARLSFCAFIVPSKLVQAHGLPWLAEHPTGTGPFRFVSWQRDQGSTLERSTTYWGKPARPAMVRFLSIPETSSRISALLAGQIDVAAGLSPDLLPRLKQDPKVKVQVVHNDRVYFVILNAHVAPFDNRSVRQAMNYAVNVQAIVDFLFKDYATRTASICGSMWDGCNSKQTPYRYDPKKARELLAAAGFPNGFQTTLAMSPQRPTASVDVSQSIALELKQVGVTAKISSLEWGNLVTDWLQARSPMYYMSFGSPVLALDDIIGAYFDPARRALWYTPPQNMIELARTALETGDLAKRAELYRQYLSLMKDEAPWLFLWTLDDITGVSTAVTGFVPRSDEMWDITGATKQ